MDKDLRKKIRKEEEEKSRLYHEEQKKKKRDEEKYEEHEREKQHSREDASDYINNYTETLKNTVSDAKNQNPYDYTTNKNITDRQKQYQQGVDEQRGYYISKTNHGRGVQDNEIRHLGIDQSELYEKSVKGGGRNTEFANILNASKEDISELLNSRCLSQKTAQHYTVADTLGRPMKYTSSYAYHTVTDGSDVGHTIRLTRDPLSFAGNVIMANAATMAEASLRNGLSSNLNKIANDYNVFGSNSKDFIANSRMCVSTGELKIIEKELRAKLKSAGHSTFDSGSSGKALTLKINSYLKANESNLSRSEIGALKMLREVSFAQDMEKRAIRAKGATLQKIRGQLLRYAQQTDLGRAIKFCDDFIRRSRRIGKLGYRTLVKLSSVIRLSAKLARRASLRTAVAIAQTALANKIKEFGEKKINALSEKRSSKLTLEQKASIEKKKQAKADRKKDQTQKRNARKDRKEAKKERKKAKKEKKQSKKNARARRKEAIMHPFRTMIGRTKAGQAVSHAFEMVAQIISQFKMYIIIALAGLILLAFVVTCTIVMFATFRESRNLANSHQGIRIEAFKKIGDCYNSDLNYIMSLRSSGKYRNVVVEYNDVRDDAAYVENMEEGAQRPLQDTNAGEIMAMALVRFDFDFEKAGEKEVVKYVEQLYRGSHNIVLTESPAYTYVNADGQEVQVCDAKIIWTTYYFNKLFDCNLNTGTTSTNYQIPFNETTQQIWDHLINYGMQPIQVAGIMGNMYAESGMNPGLQEYGSGIGYGLCQWSFGRRDNLEAFARSKGKPVSDVGVQLEFLTTELGPGNFNRYYTNKDNYKLFMTAPTPDDATYYFMWGWERPNAKAGISSLAKRQTAAREYYRVYYIESATQ